MGILICCTTGLSLNIVAYFSDKWNLRGPFIIGGSIVSLIGFIILITQVRPGVGYVGTIIATTGLFPLAAVDLAWVNSIAGGDVRKGAIFSSFFKMRGLEASSRSDHCHGCCLSKPWSVCNFLRHVEMVDLMLTAFAHHSYISSHLVSLWAMVLALDC